MEVWGILVMSDYRMRRVYVIMASYLEEYKGCSKDRIFKFKRAVDSFLVNDYQYKNLIIVADGCVKTKQIYDECYSSEDEITCLMIPKQLNFSGKVRNVGIECAKKIGDSDDLVCYLDTDDRFGQGHLSHIILHFKDDFVFYDTYRVSIEGWYISRAEMAFCKVGTSSFAHKLNLDICWPNGYGHDWGVLKKLSQKYKFSKIPMAEYYIHHVPNFDC